MAKGTSIEFYSSNQEEIMSWIEAFKSSVILLDLTNEYTIGKVLGRGTSGQVNLGTRKSDPNQ